MPRAESSNWRVQGWSSATLVPNPSFTGLPLFTRLSPLQSSRSGSEGQEVVLFSSEREAWGREKVRLEKSLRQAEAELTRLRGEIRSDTLRDVTAPDGDSAALKVRCRPDLVTAGTAVV